MDGGPTILKQEEDIVKGACGKNMRDYVGYKFTLLFEFRVQLLVYDTTIVHESCKLDSDD